MRAEVALVRAWPSGSDFSRTQMVSRTRMVAFRKGRRAVLLMWVTGRSRPLQKRFSTSVSIGGGSGRGSENRVRLLVGVMGVAERGVGHLP